MYICGIAVGKNKNMERFITGNKFKEIADFTFSSQPKHSDDYYSLPNTYNPDSIKDGYIIYTDTGYVQEFFNIVSKLDKQITLITHNGDIDINIIPPANIIKWFTINVDIIHSKIESIPLGLENSLWFPGTHKKEKMIAKLSESRDYRNLAYMDHNVGTNLSTRLRLYQIYEDESWVTANRGSNRQSFITGKFGEYLDNVYNHKFVFSPEGNSIDTHRKWEALYLGTIPIERRNINNQFYTDLPICFVDDWENVTEDFLESEYTRIKSSKWNMDKITFEYWRNKIKL